MKLHVISVCHMEPEIVAWSLMRYRRTGGIVADNWWLLDNRWPLDKANVRNALEDVSHLALAFGSTLLPAEVNLGGHGGFNYVLSKLSLKDDDLVLLYDPDSNPVTDGWLPAAMDTLAADPTLGYVSLMPQSLTDRPWTFETIAGNKVAFLSVPEWWNVTLFRASVLKEGLKSDAAKWGATYYGHVEPPMFRHVRELGMRNGYLFDYREEPCPIAHPKAYTRWKQEHAYGKYAGNFDQYCEERGVK